MGTEVVVVKLFLHLLKSFTLFHFYPPQQKDKLFYINIVVFLLKMVKLFYTQTTESPNYKGSQVLRINEQSSICVKDFNFFRLFSAS